MRWRGPTGGGGRFLLCRPGSSLDVCRGRGGGWQAADCWPPRLLSGLCCGSLQGRGHCELGLRAQRLSTLWGRKKCIWGPLTSFSYVYTWGCLLGALYVHLS